MATTTPNFGWPVPTSTDLVKDGATAMEALGDAIDTSMVDLKGGTTGQILSKATNADMDFTWIANDQGDITGVTAGTGISGGGTSGTVTVTNSMATTITTKGDLVPGTGSGTFARLAAGANGETLVADSAASTGLRWQGNFAAGKNKIINGDFGVWQRGTSLATYGYLADRFLGDTNATVTQSRQTFTPGTAPVAGYEGSFFYRLAKSAGGSYVSLQQRIEDVRTFAGQTITLSFWAKIDSGTQSVGTAFDQNFGSGGSSNVTTYGSNVTLTTTWTRYSVTVTLPSVAGKTIGTSSFLNVFSLNLSSSAAITFDYWGIQLEAGSVATAFQTATGTIQGELAAAQRYYYRATATNGNYGTLSGVGIAQSTTVAQIPLALPVPLRTSPTSIDYSTIRILDGSNGFAVTAVANTFGGDNQFAPNLSFTVASGLTQWRGYYVSANNSSSGYIGLSAEL